MKSTLKTVLSMTLIALSLTAITLLRASEETAPEITVPKMSDDPKFQLDFTTAELIAVQQKQRKKPLQT